MGMLQNLSAKLSCPGIEGISAFFACGKDGFLFVGGGFFQGSPGIQRAVDQFCPFFLRGGFYLCFHQGGLHLTLADLLRGHHTGSADFFRHRVARNTHGGPDLIQFLKAFVQTAHGGGRHDEIDEINHIKHGHARPSPAGRNLFRKTVLDDGMQDPDGKYDSDPPENAEFQADIAVKVKGEIAVIPPSGVEERIKQPSGDQLHKCRQRHADQKEQQQLQRFPAVMAFSFRQAQAGGPDIRRRDRA